MICLSTNNVDTTIFTMPRRPASSHSIADTIDPIVRLAVATLTISPDQLKLTPFPWSCPMHHPGLAVAGHKHCINVNHHRARLIHWHCRRNGHGPTLLPMPVNRIPRQQPPSMVASLRPPGAYDFQRKRSRVLRPWLSVGILQAQSTNRLLLDSICAMPSPAVIISAHVSVAHAAVWRAFVHNFESLRSVTGSSQPYKSRHTTHLQVLQRRLCFQCRRAPSLRCKQPIAIVRTLRQQMWSMAMAGRLPMLRGL